MATLSARFYTTATLIFHNKTTGHEKPEITGRVPDVGADEPDGIQRGLEGRAEVRRLAPAAGLLAARVGVGTPFERGVFCLLVAFGLLSLLLLFTGLGYAPVSAALH